MFYYTLLCSQLPLISSCNRILQDAETPGKQDLDAVISPHRRLYGNLGQP